MVEYQSQLGVPEEVVQAMLNVDFGESHATDQWWATLDRYVETVNQNNREDGPQNVEDTEEGNSEDPIAENVGVFPLVERRGLGLGLSRRPFCPMLCPPSRPSWVLFLLSTLRLKR